jgi:hypothetical protein
MPYCQPATPLHDISAFLSLISFHYYFAIDFRHFAFSYFSYRRLRQRRRRRQPPIFAAAASVKQRCRAAIARCRPRLLMF